MKFKERYKKYMLKNVDMKQIHKDKDMMKYVVRVYETMRKM